MSLPKRHRSRIDLSIRCDTPLLTKHPYAMVQSFRLACRLRHRSQASVVREFMVAYLADERSILGDER